MKQRPAYPVALARAGPRLAASAVLLSGLAAAAALASGAPQTPSPSRHTVDSRTLFESGFPRADEPASRGAHPDSALGGQALYAVHCATCHGAALQGSPGVPPLEHDGTAAIDFYVTTGRMPLAVAAPRTPGERPTASMTQAFHAPPLLDARQTGALETFIQHHSDGSPDVPHVRLAPAALQRGRTIFEDNCEACHGAAAQGATVGYQWTAPPLDRATPTQIGEAIRVGPGVMPPFTERQLSAADVDAVATYVRYLVTAPQAYGGTVMAYVGPAAEGAVGAIGGVGLLFWVVYFTGTKANGRRVHDEN